MKSLSLVLTLLALVCQSAAAAPRPSFIYILADDLGEKHDLSAKHPDKVKRLRERLKACRAAAVPPKAEDQPANYKAPRVWGQ
jgi:hypothetical protein